MKYRSLVFGVTVSLSAFSLPCAAIAQDDEMIYEIDSITVTANKMEELLQDVPQSITVIDEMVMEEKGIRNIVDVIDEVPNMSVAPNHGHAVNFRGLNSSVFTNKNPVVLYIDGVPSPDRYGFDASLANVERIEVLRGPQGTLHGKDAIGGVINIVTKTPENAWSGKVGAEYGSFNFMRGVFNAAGALVKDTLYAGINGQYSQDDGWIENTLAGMNKHANREKDRRLGGYFLYTPTEDTSIRLTLANDFANQYWTDGYGLPGGTDISAFKRDDAKKVQFDVPTFDRTETNSQSLNITQDFGDLTLTSVTVRRSMKQEGEYDQDFGNGPMFAGLMQFNNTDLDVINQELRVSNNRQDGLRWVTGLFFDKEERDQGPYGMQFPNFDPVNGDFLGNYEMNSESIANSYTYAVFGQVVVPVGDRFEFTAGARWQKIEKDIDLNMYYLPIGMTGLPMFQYEADKSWRTFLPKAAVSYRINDSWTAFASYSQGYMPGGFNNYATAGTPEDNSFEPQRSSNYELGIKGTLDRVTLSASVFYMDIEDIHVYKSLGSGMYVADNAKKAYSQGAELEVLWRPATSLELTGALGVIDAKYDDYDAGGGNLYDGQAIEFTPSYTARFGVAWFGSNGWYSRADLKSQDETNFYDDAQLDFVKADAYTTLDAKIGYQAGDWELYAYGENLTDESYITNFMSQSIVALADFGEPRTFGVGMHYRF